MDPNGFDTEEVENVYSPAYNGSPIIISLLDVQGTRNRLGEEITAIREKLSCGVRRASAELAE